MGGEVLILIKGEVITYMIYNNNINDANDAYDANDN